MVSAEAAGSVEVAVRDLAIRYGDKTVLSDVSLDVRTNEIFGIIGPANSGKTSFLRVLNRMDEFTSSHRAARVSERSTMTSSSALSRIPASRGARATLS